MRKLILALVLIGLMITNSYATIQDMRVSGGTVSFSTVDATVGRYGSIVTFNSITNKIYLTNLSTVDDCWVDLRCKTVTGNTGYLTKDSATVFLPAVGQATPNTIEINFATKNLGFVGSGIDVTSNGGVSGSNRIIRYFVTGDNEEL